MTVTGRWRAALCGALLLAVGACGSTPAPPAPTARPTPSASATPSPAPGIVQVGTSLTVIAPLGLKLRDSGSTDGAVLGSLGQGTIVTVLAHSDQNGGWYQVKGETQTGWISDNTAYTSPRHFESYQSDPHGFSALYLSSWSFMEASPTSVSFRPQAGGYPEITVTNGPNLAALGTPGADGFGVVEVDAAEVFGITGVLKLYTRNGTPPPATPGQPPVPPRLAELRVTVDTTHALRLDFQYSTADDLRTFRDFYGSIILPVASSPGASPRPAA